MEPSTSPPPSLPILRDLGDDWDRSVLAHLLHLDNVWAVMVTDGVGDALYFQERKDLPQRCVPSVDLVSGCLQRTGERLELGELRVSVLMFSGALIVGRHAASGEAAFVFAAPDANLGQLLAHMRKARVSGGASGEGQA